MTYFFACPGKFLLHLQKANRMKRNVFILGNPDGKYVRQLVKTAPLDQHTTVHCFSELSSSITTGIHTPQFATFYTKGEEFSKSLSCDVVFIGDKQVLPQDQVIVRTMSSGSLESIVFRMDVLWAIQSQGTTVFNPPKSLEIAIDKYLCLTRLAKAGLPVPPTHSSQDWETALQGFQVLGGDVVVKPLFGSEGRGLIRVCDEDHAIRVCRSLETLKGVIYQQKFIRHEIVDTRVLILGNQHWAIQRSHASDWRTNTSRGAASKPVQLSSETLELAIAAAKCLGIPFAGVDLVWDTLTRQHYVLEVNGVPGWDGVATACSVDIAKAIWDYLQEF